MNANRLGFVVAFLVSLGACKTVSKSSESTSVQQDNPSPVKTVQVRGTREVSGPVRVALFRPTVSRDLKKTVNRDKLFEMWDAEFLPTDSIKRVDQKKVDKAQKERAGADRFKKAVHVRCKVTHVMKTGVSKSTGKVVTVPYMVLTARIEWKAQGRSETISVEGSFFENARLVKELAAHVKRKL